MKPQSPTFIACPRHPDWHTQALEREIYGRVPLPFEPCLAGNCGQAGAATKFVSRGAGYSLFLAETEAVLAFDRPRPGPGAVDARLRMKLVGANRALRVRAAKKLSGRMNYFIGNDPKKWRTSVSTYAEVRYENVYPGIDVVFYGKQGQLEYDFIVAPGADPKVIRFELSGADQTKLDDNGDLLVAGASGEIRLRAPVIYQEVDGGREEIPGRYVLEGAGRVRFEVGAYDSARPLVIDPVLYYYTYLYVPNVGAMAVDGSGDVYLTGQCGGVAAFVAKVKPATSELVYLAHLGNYNADNFGTGISVDAFGNAYVTGWTTARDFPVVNAVQPIKPTPSGPSAFVAKLDPTGSSLLYSTYLGQPPRPSRSRTGRAPSPGDGASL